MVRKASNTDPNKKPVKFVPVKPLRFTEEQMAAALKHNHGRIYDAAKELDCNPETVRNYTKRFPRLKAIMRACRQTALQGVIDKMYELALNGNEKCIKFVLVLTPEARELGYGVQPKLIDVTAQTQTGKVDVKTLPTEVANKILEKVKQQVAQQKALEQQASPPPQIGLKELPAGAAEVVEVRLDEPQSGSTSEPSETR